MFSFSTLTIIKNEVEEVLFGLAWVKLKEVLSMNRKIQNIILSGAAALVLMNAGSAMALYISDGTDVGVVDTLSAQTTLANSGDATEINWVNGVLGLTGVDAYTASSFVKDDDLAGDWMQVYSDMLATSVVADTFAYALTSSPPPEYFLLKIGGGNWSGDTHYLFSNNSELTQAVVDLNVFGYHLNNKPDTVIDITRISHLDEFGASQIPEPATILLFGAGLLGIAGLRLRKQ